MKIHENQWKSIKINRNQWKSIEINENRAWRPKLEPGGLMADMRNLHSLYTNRVQALGLYFNKAIRLEGVCAPGRIPCKWIAGRLDPPLRRRASASRAERTRAQSDATARVHGRPWPPSPFSHKKNVKLEPLNSSRIYAINENQWRGGMAPLAIQLQKKIKARAFKFVSEVCNQWKTMKINKNQ